MGIRSIMKETPNFEPVRYVVAASAAVLGKYLLEGRQVYLLGLLIPTGLPWKIAAFAGGGIFALLGCINIIPKATKDKFHALTPLAQASIVPLMLIFLPSTSPVSILTFLACGTLGLLVVDTLGYALKLIPNKSKEAS